jgi:DNA-binding LacI/PurR family transcriptional regulator
MTDPAPLPELIRQDILRRGLRPGDAYITTREAGTLFGVSPATANRALNELARDGLLVRRQGSGTVVAGDAPAAARPDALLHVLCGGNYGTMPKRLFDDLLRGLSRSFPHAESRIAFLPPHDEPRFLEDWRAAVDQRKQGVVLVLSTPPVQRFFADAGLPAVLAGSPGPGAPTLPWVDADHRQGGRILAEHLFHSGHRHIALLMRDIWGAGDNLFLEGVHQAQAEHGLAGSPLLLRSLTADPEVVTHTVDDLLRTDAPPTALVCRSEAIAEWTEATIARNEADVVVARADGFSRGKMGPALRAAMSREDQAERTGRVLAALVDGRTPEPACIHIPMKLTPPPGGAVELTTQAHDITNATLSS